MSHTQNIPGVPASEFSEDFVRLMRNRMAVSFFKYGLLTDGFPHKVDAVSSMQARLDRYAATGNTEWLVDAANFCMIEFMLPRHPRAHFEGTDDSASPGRVSTRTGRDDKRDNVEIGTNEKSRTARFR